MDKEMAYRTTTKVGSKLAAVWIDRCHKWCTTRISIRSYFLHHLIIDLDDDIKSDVLKFADDVKPIGRVKSVEDVDRLKINFKI